MSKQLFSRRRFLQQTSLGAVGLVVSSRVFAANDASTNGISSAAGEASAGSPEAFEPVRYRPMPARVTRLGKNTASLDGVWRIHPNPGEGIREQPLSAGGWKNFKVPGQWVQQGYDIPQEQTVALGREFTVPAKWAGYRIFVRFDAIHGGTRYWLNGRLLGYSENLFTPAEWEITNAVKFGRANRLDLEMKVATASERLSYSCGYTGYSLGGIDRGVKIYALPKLHIASLWLNAGLDEDYRDGVLQIELQLDNPGQTPASGLAIAMEFFDERGKRVEHSNSRAVLDELHAGLKAVNIESRVANPLKWNAEQPNLYRLVLTLERDGRQLEQIERRIGFRAVEIKGRQLYVNGVRVKLAGVCRHEIDPLTGRANTMRHAETDVKLFKSANLNYVRTSHYPCTQEFLDAADRYGLYVESEAPLCWVQRAKDLKDLKTVLTATAAMIDYNHAHPCVILWSLANESNWSGLFDESNKLCKQLDPTRPTTIEHTFTDEDKVTCDILSRHYQQMPYDKVLKDDARPFLHGECFFLVYHERTDVAINPGLRQMWAAGSAAPDSEWGRACIENVKDIKGLVPGIYPGAWSYICASEQCIGSEIWSGVDDIAFLPDGKVVSSENGNALWGLIDGWRRPKPELELAKFLFSPVWFPLRQLDYLPGQSSVRVPVENRHSFRDLSEFDFVWQLKGAKGKARVNVPPGERGAIEIPIRHGAPSGETLLVRVMNGGREIVNATLALGRREPVRLAQAQAGAPRWSDEGRRIIVEGRGFGLAFDRATGDFDTTHPKHRAPIKTFPCLHVTRHDFGDLEKKKPPYAVFPDGKTRVVESVTAAEMDGGLELTVKDQYEHFAGSMRWLIDKGGVGRIAYDYTYAGPDLDSREVGVRVLLAGQYDEVKWRRWSEWGIFPEDSICRTEGRAKARRDKKWPEQPANAKPHWPWSQDQTDLGTADFRSIKFHIYEASLVAADGSGVRVEANADIHFRACMTESGIRMHILSQCPLAPVVLAKGARLAGNFSIRLMPGPRLKLGV